MARQRYSLRDRAVLVTGAARGIGAAVARDLHARGALVSLVGLEPDQLQALAAELGDRAMWVEADVSDRQAIEAAVAQTVERFGGLDVVIANAGIALSGSVLAVDPDAFDRLIEVNLLGVWRTVRAALPHIAERKGYVLIVASAAAIVHAPGMSAYNTAKAGIEAFGDTLRSEMRHRGVGVGVAYFSWIDTDMVRGADERPALRQARTSLGPAGRKAPLSDAVGAVANGIETRAPIVVVPGWLKGMLALRGVLTPLIGRLAARRYSQHADIVDEEARRYTADGAAAVGPGGAAGMATGNRFDAGRDIDGSPAEVHAGRE